jgi:hypothetical protein
LNQHAEKKVTVPDVWYMPGFALAADLTELIPSSWISHPTKSMGTSIP